MGVYIYIYIYIYIYQCANSSVQLPSKQNVMASNTNTQIHEQNSLYAENNCAIKQKHYSRTRKLFICIYLQQHRKLTQRHSVVSNAHACIIIFIIFCGFLSLAMHSKNVVTSTKHMHESLFYVTTYT